MRRRVYAMFSSGCCVLPSRPFTSMLPEAPIGPPFALRELPGAGWGHLASTYDILPSALRCFYVYFFLPAQAFHVVFSPPIPLVVAMWRGLASFLLLVRLHCNFGFSFCTRLRAALCWSLTLAVLSTRSVTLSVGWDSAKGRERNCPPVCKRRFAVIPASPSPNLTFVATRSHRLCVEFLGVSTSLSSLPRKAKIETAARTKKNLHVRAVVSSLVFVWPCSCPCLTPPI